MAPSSAAGELVEANLGVSWIRVYVLLRATSQRVSRAEVAAEVGRLGSTPATPGLYLLDQGCDFAIVEWRDASCFLFA